METRRKNIRLSREAYEIPFQLFSVTICTQERRRLFENEKLAELVLDSLVSGSVKEQTERYAWCLMPDHLHLLIAPRKENLIDLLNGWKSYTAHLLQKEIRKACEISDQNGGRGRPPYEVDARHIRRGSVPVAQNKIAGDGGPTKDQVDGFRTGSVPAAPARIWQRGFYDHALRKEEDVQKVAEYIVNNPVRMGLVEDWRNYRFSWHKWM